MCTSHVRGPFGFDSTMTSAPVFGSTPICGLVCERTGDVSLVTCTAPVTMGLSVVAASVTPGSSETNPRPPITTIRRSLPQYTAMAVLPSCARRTRAGIEPPRSGDVNNELEGASAPDGRPSGAVPRTLRAPALAGGFELHL